MECLVCHREHTCRECGSWFAIVELEADTECTETCFLCREHDNGYHVLSVKGCAFC